MATDGTLRVSRRDRVKHPVRRRLAVAGAKRAARGRGAFLLFALLSLVAMMWFRRIYHGLRRVRWQQELRRSQAALDDLLHAGPAPLSDPSRPPTEAPGPPANDTHPPSLQTRRLLLAIGTVGLLLACGGCAALVPGNFTLGRLAAAGRLARS